MKIFSLGAAVALTAISGADAQTVGRASYYTYSRSADLVAAHRTLPIGARVKVTNLGNGRTATVVIVGRGPFVRGRIIDVSTKVADLLAFRQAGVASVKIELVQGQGAEALAPLAQTSPDEPAPAAPCAPECPGTGAGAK